MAGVGTAIWLFRYLAADHKYQHYHYHIPDGVCNTHSQNKDTMALQLKLNELIASHEKASNRLIDIEDLTEDELVQLKKFYIKLSRLAEKEANLTTSHTLEEAMHLHESKKSYKAKTKTGK